MTCLPGMLLRYFLNNFEMVPVAPVITGITFALDFLGLFFFYRVPIF